MKNYEVPGQAGECFSCARLSTCTATNLEKVLGDFSCPLYVPIAEPVFWARYAMMEQFGSEQAVRALLGGREEKNE